MKRQHVDGVTDLATALPLSVVPDLVGWPEDHRRHLLRWGGATFDGTVTLIESVVAQLGLKQSRRNTVGSFTFQAAASGAVT